MRYQNTIPPVKTIITNSKFTVVAHPIQTIQTTRQLNTLTALLHSLRSLRNRLYILRILAFPIKPLDILIVQLFCIPRR